MMLNRAMQSYQSISAQTSVGISEPADLILLVFEKLFDHLNAAEQDLSRGENAQVPFDKAIDIFTIGLVPALDLERGGQIAANLASLYDWSIRHLLKAKIHKDAAMVREVHDVLLPIYESWRDAVVPLGKVA
jgi:flagellar secretion chaperone FliS